LLIAGIVLLVLWVLGIAGSYTLGRFTYVSLVIGLVLLVAWFFLGYRRRRHS